MKIKAIYYHAGCPICVEAETALTHLLDRNQVDLEIVHLGRAADRVEEAEAIGIESVPALVLGDSVLHINFGAAIGELK